MVSEQRTALPSYMTRLLSTGRVVFSRDEAQAALGFSQGALMDAAERQQRRQHLISPRRGFYVIVPPQYLAWGAPPPPWYIDDLMQHEGRPYYVGLLKAAELHGATHQAVMEFQVITDKRLPKIRAGRSTMAFYYRKDIGAVSAGIEDQKTGSNAGLCLLAGRRSATNDPDDEHHRLEQIRSVGRAAAGRAGPDHQPRHRRPLRGPFPARAAPVPRRHGAEQAAFPRAHPL